MTFSFHADWIRKNNAFYLNKITDKPRTYYLDKIKRYISYASPDKDKR